MEASASKGQVSTITKVILEVETGPCYQTQQLSMKENNFLFLIRQEKQFITK
jgi:hypothetical protein